MNRRIFGIHGLAAITDSIAEIIGSPVPGSIITLQHGKLRLIKDSGNPLKVALV